MNSIPPLNGVKTHPLSEHSKKVLWALSKEPKGFPQYWINPGALNRMLRGEFVRIENKQVYITDLGRLEKIPCASH